MKMFVAVEDGIRIVGHGLTRSEAGKNGGRVYPCGGRLYAEANRGSAPAFTIEGGAALFAWAAGW